MKSLVWRARVTLKRALRAERAIDAVLLAERDVRALADVVEREQFDHQMMHAVAAGLDQRQTVMPRVDVQKEGLEWRKDVIGQLEAEHIGVERHHGIDLPDRQHRVAQSERAGAKARDRAPRLERADIDVRAVKRLEPIAGRIVERNESGNKARVGEVRRLA